MGLFFAVCSQGSFINDIYYFAPKVPKLSMIPHSQIKLSVTYINIVDHPITSFGENEFSRYKKLTMLKVDRLPIGNNIAPSAFANTALDTLIFIRTGTTSVPKAILSLNSTLDCLHLNYCPLQDISNLVALIKISPSLRHFNMEFSIKSLDLITGLWGAMCQMVHQTYYLSIKMVVS
jgi:hypothetical protein